jgi:hypothetical protein
MPWRIAASSSTVNIVALAINSLSDPDHSYVGGRNPAAQNTSI